MSDDQDTLYSDENAARLDDALRQREVYARRLHRLRPTSVPSKVLSFRKDADIPRIGKEDPQGA